MNHKTKSLKENLFENTYDAYCEYKDVMKIEGPYYMPDSEQAKFDICYGMIEEAGLEKEYQAWKKEKSLP